jgi:ribonuclease G
MKKEIIINTTNEEARIAIRENNRLVELFVERPEAKHMVGDIYKGKVSRILPGMQAVFIDIGLEQNAFLHFSDVSHAIQRFIADFEDNEEGKNIEKKQPEFFPEKELVKNQDIVVQIMKEPIGSKGSRVTSQISIPGRFAVLIPNHNIIGVSRKISNFREKRRLKTIVQKVLPKNYGLIVRTIAEGRGENDITNDIHTLIKIWEKINKKIKETQAPALVYKDAGIASSIIRDLFTSDVTNLVVDSRKLMREITIYIKDVAPALKHKIEYYKKNAPIFDYYNIEEEIKQSMASKVWLKNGAYIVIEPTEALVAIDVNSGKYIGKKDHETNSLKINLEAAKEIARQARLRDLGGLIVIDFIDVQQEENKLKIYQELKREFRKDRSITKLEALSRFGLLEMTRQRIRPSVLYSINEDCTQCHGTGVVPTIYTLVSEIERWIQRYRSNRGDRRISIHVTENTYKYMTEGRFNKRLLLMWKYWMKIKLVIDPILAFREFRVYDHTDQKELKVEK